MMAELSWQEFERVEMRVGTILAVSDFEKAKRPAYQLTIDFGEELGVRRSSAQLTGQYKKEELIGCQVIAVVNFPVKQIANFFSTCLVLGAVSEDGAVTLLKPERPVLNGLRIL